MKERPIIFNSEMVRAILEARKTQTRRPLKDQLEYIRDPRFGYSFFTDEGTMSVRGWFGSDLNREYGEKFFKLPHGKPGDRLWVRETFEIFDCQCSGADSIFQSQCKYCGGRGETVEYRATEKEGLRYPHWSPSIHMPRWASRITLEITDVRVERVQDISQEDALKEGIVKCEKGFSEIPNQNPNKTLGSPKMAFANLWCRVYGGKNWNLKNQNSPWDENPWVWVVEFKRMD